MTLSKRVSYFPKRLTRLVSKYEQFFPRFVAKKEKSENLRKENFITQGQSGSHFPHEGKKGDGENAVFSLHSGFTDKLGSETPKCKNAECRMPQMFIGLIV